jgi:hypothetical protein
MSPTISHALPSQKPHKKTFPAIVTVSMLSNFGLCAALMWFVSRCITPAHCFIIRPYFLIVTVILIASGVILNSPASHSRAFDTSSSFLRRIRGPTIPQLEQTYHIVCLRFAIP